MSELYHYGRLGMKWGQHIFGEKARQHRLMKKELKKKHPLDVKDSKIVKEQKKSSGIKTGLISDSISKGASVYRFSSKRVETNDGRKYASVIKMDRRSYKKDALANGLSNKGNDVYLHRLETTKRLKVVKGSKVTKDLIKRYGDKDVKEAYKAVRDLPVRDSYHKLWKELKNPENENHWMAKPMMVNQGKVSDFVHKTLYDKNKSNEVFERYRKKGYDAMVDAEDWLDGYTYPIILLDPKSSTKTKSVRRIR